MIRKLRRKFVLINMSIVTVLLVVMLGLVLRFNSVTLERQSISAMRRMAAASVAPFAPGSGVPEEPTMLFFTLELTRSGELVALGSEYYDLSDEDHLRTLLEAARNTGRESGVLEEYGLRFHRESTPRGSRYLFADVSGERMVLRNLLRSCMMVGVLSFAAFFLVSILLANWAIRPVEQAWEQQRQFVADASHELKTPLAVIMANAELLQNPQCTPQDQSRFSGHILSVSYQMRALVERMLEMARVDTVKLKLEPLELSQLIRDAVLSVQLLYEERGRPLEYAIREDVFIRGSENHLYQLMDVLLDNALKYSSGEGSVRVELRPQGRSCLLTVESPGTPLTARQCRDVFKRFYRVDSARAMDGSYGLGLAIAQGIVSAHRGSIRASSGGNTNCFTVQLPLCDGNRCAGREEDGTESLN